VIGRCPAEGHEVKTFCATRHADRLSSLLGNETRARTRPRERRFHVEHRLQPRDV
jgi:hypothetical protein